MASNASIQLPKIDFSELKNHNPDNLLVWEFIKTQVFNALQEYGCFEASSVVSTDLQESVNDALKQLFDLPLETKQRNTSETAFHGYVQSPKVPLYESMGIGNSFIPENIHDFANLMWPHGNPDFWYVSSLRRYKKKGILNMAPLIVSKLATSFVEILSDNQFDCFFCDSTSIETYSRKLWKLDKMVKRMVFESLDLDKYFDEQMKSTSYLLKLMKYRAPEPNESDIGLHNHTDTNILTILHQDKVEGLEIQTKDGEWIRVKVSPNSFVVVAGETFNVWLNGRLHVPFHRVVMKGNTTRYSLGFFSVQSSLVKAFGEMVDEEHPLLYKPFDYNNFLKFFYKEGGVRSNFALKTYCGNGTVD